MRTDKQIYRPEFGLTQRDNLVLSGLEQWGILGLGQLMGLVVDVTLDARQRSERFFNSTSAKDYRCGLGKRLLLLARRGFIAQRFFLNRTKLFMLTEKGHHALRSAGMAALDGCRSHLADELVEHELTVAAVGLVAAELLGLSVSTERERYAWSGNGGRRPAPVRAVSDLWISGPQPRAVEVELSQKSESRYQEIWDAYRLRLRSNAAVAYLVSWPSGVDCILRHARRFQASFVYACALSDFRASAGTAPFRGIKTGDFIRLESASPRGG